MLNVTDQAVTMAGMDSVLSENGIVNPCACIMDSALRFTFLDSIWI